MGLIVSISWLLFLILFLVHLRYPTLIPLQIRVSSYYVPLFLIGIYAFKFGILGWIAVFAILLKIGDDLIFERPSMN